MDTYRIYIKNISNFNFYLQFTRVMYFNIKLLIAFKRLLLPNIYTILALNNYSLNNFLMTCLFTSKILRFILFLWNTIQS